MPPKPQLTSDSELSDKPATVTPRYKKKTTNSNNKNSANKIGTSAVKSKLNSNKINNNDMNNQGDTSINKNPSGRKNNNKETIADSTTDLDNTDVEKKIPRILDNDNSKRMNKNNNPPMEISKEDEIIHFKEPISPVFPNEIDILEIKNASMKLFDELSNSTATIVPVTAATVTKPLKIDANLERKDLPKGISPMVDGRILSATSVSNAINKMNDTVLDTKTLMRESGLSKLSPAANAIISMSRENNPKLKKTDKESLENKPNQIKLEKQNSADSNKVTPNNTSAHNGTPPDRIGNHVTTIGLMDVKTMERQVQNNMSKLIGSEKPIGDTTSNMVNKKIAEKKNVITSDVRPIQILVKEKPSDEDVESGNMRVPYSATNGSLHRRPR